jgi:uncharacterized protein YdhG (YjbR/CyaY superfamily)
MKAKPATIDDYLARVPDEQRKVLEALRKTIHAAAPGAEECISYNLPAFRLDGRVIAGFAAGVKLCSYYPFSGRTLTTLRDELDGYEMSKGALRFAASRPLPAKLVRKLVKARIAEER